MQALFALLLLLAALSSTACDINGYDRFVPSIKNFESKLNKEGVIAELPAPKPRLIGVRRGMVAAGSSCDDAGLLSVELEWPAASEYELSEVGFYFRPATRKSDPGILPAKPIIGTIKGRRMRFLFPWLDGDPSQQAPLDLEIEVFAVNRGLQIGPSARFKVKAAPGSASGTTGFPMRPTEPAN